MEQDKRKIYYVDLMRCGGDWYSGGASLLSKQDKRGTSVSNLSYSVTNKLESWFLFRTRPI